VQENNSKSISIMATRGIFQLQTLKFFYCEHGGSSRTVRDFISSGRIVRWAMANPQVDVEVKVRNGQHPYVLGEYLTGNPKQVGVKNEDMKRIYEVIDMLKNSSGRKIKRLQKPVVTQTPTIQGIWTPMLDIKDAEFDIEYVYGKQSESGTSG
jgi:large subunit ribosomal protein L43